MTEQNRNILPFARRVEKTDPFAFDALPLKFEYSNDSWGRDNLTFVRIASLICSRNYREVEQNVRDMLEEDDLFPELLANIQATKDHLIAIAEMMKIGEARLLMTVARIDPTTPQ